MSFRRNRIALAALFVALLPATACAGPRAQPAPVPVPREGFVAGADGVRLYYRLAGSGRDTVVVLHGGPGVGHQVLAPDLEPLERQYTVLYYDQRGGGRSGLPDTTLLGMDRFVEDLEAVRRHFGMERVTLLAHSFGPLLAASYARSYPHRVERMVFVGAIGPRRADGAAFAQAQAQQRDTARERRWRVIVERIRTGTPGDAVDACRDYEEMMREAAAARGTPRSRGTSCEAPPEAVQYGYRHTSQRTPRSLGDWDFTGALGHVRAPLLVITGDRDETPLAGHRAWAAAVPNGRLLVIPGAGHAPHVEAPGVFFPAVEAFLAGGWPAGAEDPTP
ncbi:MAG: alpha/beta fold hydrolase [Gemmatimonadetes bacterium]|nr:alpha/beta fold hydrolase [Gemmatimonadota bacterium]